MGGRGNLAITALLAVLTAFMLGACGGGGDGSTGQDGTDRAEKTTAQASPDGGEKEEAPPSEKGQGAGKQKPEQAGAPDSDEPSDGGESAGNGGNSQGEQGQGPSGQGQKPQESGGGSKPAPSPELEGIKDYGSEAPSGESDEAVASLEAYLKSFAGGDWKAVCGRLAKPVLGTMQKLATATPELKGEDCVGIMAKSGGFGAKPDPNVNSVDSFRVEGTVGYIFYNGNLVMLMEKEGGDWKVNGIQPEQLS